MGEIFQGKVRSLSFKGLGVVDHPNGVVFFVHGVWPGDEGAFEITSQKKNYGFAQLKELLKPSTDRRKPPCPHFGFEDGQCGGCSWIFVNYASQVKQKQQLVQQLTSRAQILKDPTSLKEIWSAPEEFGYRNRAQLKTDGQHIGYVSRETNILAPIEQCLILNKKNQDTLTNLIKKLPCPEWAQSEEWNTLDIDDEMKAEEVSLNKKRPFRQANHAQNIKMKEWLSSKLKSCDSKSEAIELFCGSGNFTETFSQNHFQNILAIEGSSQAIQVLKERNLKNVKVMTLDLYNIKNFNQFKSLKPQILFLDPPRQGFDQLDLFLKMFKSIKEIFYVSCDLSTYINDVKKILPLGYEVVEIQPIDQFPQTPHIEILSHLKLSDA